MSTDDDLLSGAAPPVGDNFSFVERRDVEDPDGKQRRWLKRTAFYVVFGITILWLIVVLIYVYLQATGSSFCHSYVGVSKKDFPDPFFHLSDSVIITLISTSTANVLAFLVIILNDLFSRGKASK